MCIVSPCQIPRKKMEERNFVCKYCNRRFPCGKSLGGHIRTHMSSSSDRHHNNNNDDGRNNSNVAVIKFDSVRKRKRDFLGSKDGAGDGNDGNILNYGLRENPKKTMRFVHSNSNAASSLQLDKFCKECGKGFTSLKALCGHMACHSEKEKPTNNNNNNRFDNYYDNNSNYNNNDCSGMSEKQKLVMDSQSDTETNSAPRRSKRMMRFKTITNNHNPNSSATIGNGSSSVSEVEQEQEEVARCLMMLSKDNTHKGRFALFTESSDNNSVVLEAKSKSKSPSFDTKVIAAGAAGAINNDKVMDKDMKLKYDEVDYDSDNSDSGYFRNGPKKVDSDDSSEGFFRNEEEVIKPSKKVLGDYDVESRKILSRGGGGRSKKTVFKKLVLDDPAKRKQSCDTFSKNSLGISSNGFTNDKNCKNEFLNNGSYGDSAYQSSDEIENSTDTESYRAPKPHNNDISNNKSLSSKKSCKVKKKPKSKLKKSKSKSKNHECPICNKIFRSGQALGGHKRSHFVGGSEENTLVIRTSAPNPPPPIAVPCLIDLNLPASFDE